MGTRIGLKVDENVKINVHKIFACCQRIHRLVVGRSQNGISIRKPGDVKNSVMEDVKGMKIDLIRNANVRNIAHLVLSR